MSPEFSFISGQKIQKMKLIFLLAVAYPIVSSNIRPQILKWLLNQWKAFNLFSSIKLLLFRCAWMPPVSYIWVYTNISYKSFSQWFQLVSMWTWNRFVILQHLWMKYFSPLAATLPDLTGTAAGLVRGANALVLGLYLIHSNWNRRSLNVIHVCICRRCCCCHSDSWIAWRFVFNCMFFLLRINSNWLSTGGTVGAVIVTVPVLAGMCSIRSSHHFGIAFKISIVDSPWKYTDPFNLPFSFILWKYSNPFISNNRYRSEWCNYNSRSFEQLGFVFLNCEFRLWWINSDGIYLVYLVHFPHSCGITRITTCTAFTECASWWHCCVSVIFMKQRSAQYKQGSSFDV